MPKISIIIPTYNRAQLLAAALASVQRQSFTDYSVIVVDDGSTDETATLFRGVHDGVMYRRIEHVGQPAVARNVGWRATDSEFVAFLDSDDQWVPHKLARQIAFLEQHSRIGLVCSNAFVSGQPLNSPSTYHSPAVGDSPKNLSTLLDDNFVITSTVVVRRRLLEQSGGFSERAELTALEDYDLWLRLASATEIAYEIEPLAYYRDDPADSLRGARSTASHCRGQLVILDRLYHQLRARRRLDGLLAKRLLGKRRVWYGAWVRSLVHERRPVSVVRAAARWILIDPVSASVFGFRAFNHRARTTVRRAIDWLAGRPMPVPIAADGKLRLHLGCGEVYLPGYVNIDYPPAEHTVQQTSRADRFADITQLEYTPGSVHEVRLHHVFEHFDRPTALSLLVAWYAWLEDGGRLVIETPDFERSARAFLLGGETHRFKALRHIFGSQEAGWAIHLDGWYQSKFRRVLTSLGYRNLRFRATRWHDTHNLTVVAHKRAPFHTIVQQQHAMEDLLRLSVIDNARSEERLLQYWLSKLRLPGAR